MTNIKINVSVVVLFTKFENLVINLRYLYTSTVQKTFLEATLTKKPLFTTTFLDSVAIFTKPGYVVIKIAESELSSQKLFALRRVCTIPYVCIINVCNHQQPVFTKIKI